MDLFFEFEKAKLFDTWKRARNNKYSDDKLQEFHDLFRDFYNKIKNSDIKTLSTDKKRFLKLTIDYFQNRVNCLSNNTATNAPYEVVESLKSAAKDWVADIDKYIILTRYGDYSFFFDRKEDIVLSYIANDYNISFDYKTVLLSIPQHYYRDYMNNVVLYHEIGHFVDVVNNISDTTAYLMLEDFKKGNNIAEIHTYFPFLNGKKYEDMLQANGDLCDNYKFTIGRHWMEFFADLFATSYVGDSIKKYLSYCAFPDCASEQFAPTHPSNKNRFDVIDDFMSKKDNYIIKTIQTVLRNKFNGKELECYHNQLSSNDIYKLLPIELNDDSDIHSIYTIAWDVWYGDWEKFKSENYLTYDLHPTQIYYVINNIVEKSLSNYFTQKKWKNVP